MNIKVETVTPDLAAEYLTRNTRNRNVRPRSVDALERDMRADAWAQTGEPIRFDWDGVLIDGQHRLAAIVQSGRAQELVVIRGLDPASQTVVDVGDKRTSGDQLQLAGYANAKTLAAAARLGIRRDRRELRILGGRNWKPTTSELKGWIDRHPDLVDHLPAGQQLRKRLGGPPAGWTLALWCTHRIDGAEAKEFWQGVLEGAGLDSGDPRLTLRDTVMRLQARSVAGVSRLPADALIGLVAKAWNAYRGGRQMMQMKVGSLKGEPEFV